MVRCVVEKKGIQALNPTQALMPMGLKLVHTSLICLSPQPPLRFA